MHIVLNLNLTCILSLAHFFLLSITAFLVLFSEDAVGSGTAFSQKKTISNLCTMLAISIWINFTLN